MTTQASGSRTILITPTRHVRRIRSPFDVAAGDHPSNCGTSRPSATGPSGRAAHRPRSSSWVDPILEETTTLKLATGIVNIWTAEPGPVAESFHRIEKAYPGRFLLGIGVGHPEATQEYRKPIDAITDYLDKLDEYGVPKDSRVVAALGAEGAEAVGGALARARTRTSRRPSTPPRRAS